VITQPRRQKT